MKYNSNFCHSYGNLGKLQGNPLHPQRPLLIELHLIKAGRLFHRMISPVLRFSTGTAEGSNSD